MISPRIRLLLTFIACSSLVTNTVFPAAMGAEKPSLAKGRQYFEHGDCLNLTPLAEHLDWLIAKDPDISLWYAARAEALNHLGQKAQARADTERAAKLEKEGL
ncbi:MAG TPA: hypothetical protein V6D17_06855 [Candidatus Obscuribacterales bacterium]